MLAAAKALSRVRALGVTIVPDGNRLRFHPASALTPELLEELRQHKEGILEILRRRERAQRKDTVTPPPPPRGRDPLARRGTEKGRFFKGDWRTTWPRDFKVREGGEEV